MDQNPDEQLKTDIRFMKEALKEAQKAYDADEVPVGAVIVCRDKIIARSFNLTERLNDVTAHAEMQAFTSASGFLGGKYLENCTLYVTVEPCPMCAGAAFWTQISRIVWGTNDPKRGFTTVKSSLLHPKTTVASGILKDECQEIIQRFFQSRR